MCRIDISPFQDEEKPEHGSGRQDSLRQLAVAVAVLVFLWCSTWRPLARAQQPLTIWDGVYTVTQAKYGERLYAEQCAVCHGATPVGTANAPALSGEDFVAEVYGATLADLFQTISRAMPANDPGRLTPEEAAALLAFLASSNGWPAGPRDLPSAAEALKLIRILRR